MPRAFLITNRRYEAPVVENEQHSARDRSPERSVRTADGFGDDISLTEISPLQPDSPHSPASLSRDYSASFHLLDHCPSPYSIYGQLEPLVLTVPKERRDADDDHLTLSEHKTDNDVPPLPPVHHPHLHHPPHQHAFFHSGENYFYRPPPVIHSLKGGTGFHHVPPSVGSWSNEDSSSDCSSSSVEEAALALTVESHACPECGKRYSTSSNLARHRQTHRSATDRKARKCPHCDKVYVSMPAYSMHVRTHSQGCQCPYCGKSFSRPWLLQGHIRTHTGEKPFKCPICSKAFADKSNLRAHIQTHSSSKPYVCQRCGKAFALKSYLYKHEESSCMRLHKQQRPQLNNSPLSGINSRPLQTDP